MRPFPTTDFRHSPAVCAGSSENFGSLGSDPFPDDRLPTQPSGLCWAVSEVSGQTSLPTTDFRHSPAVCAGLCRKSRVRPLSRRQTSDTAQRSVLGVPRTSEVSGQTPLPTTDFRHSPAVCAGSSNGFGSLGADLSPVDRLPTQPSGLCWEFQELRKSRVRPLSRRQTSDTAQRSVLGVPKTSEVSGQTSLPTGLRPVIPRRVPARWPRRFVLS